MDTYLAVLAILAAISSATAQDLDPSRVSNELRDSIRNFNAKLKTHPQGTRIASQRLWSPTVLDNRGAYICSNRTFNELLLGTTELDSDLKQSAKVVLEKYLEHCAALIFKPIIDNCQRNANVIPSEVLQSSSANSEPLPINSAQRLLHGVAWLMSRSGNLDPSKFDSNTRFSLDIERNIRRFKQAYLSTCGPVFYIEDEQPWLVDLMSRPEYFYMFEAKLRAFVNYITICHRTRHAYSLQLDALMQLIQMLEQRRFGDDPAAALDWPSTSGGSGSREPTADNIWLKNIFGDVSM